MRRDTVQNSHFMVNPNMNRLTVVGLAILCLCPLVYSVEIKGSKSYAQYSLWNVCQNSSISFSFKTSRITSNKTLLMYTDDHGAMDFIQIRLAKTFIKLAIKISNVPDKVSDGIINGTFDDDRWHSVTVKRNREITVFTVDSNTINFKLQAEELIFGSTSEHNYVYFGGIPNLSFRKLSNPDIKSWGNFEGLIRNVIYGNCTCIPVRAELIGGVNIKEEDSKTCLKSTDCDKGCICIRTNYGFGCDCIYRETCLGAQQPAKYYLPMDKYSSDQKLDSDSGLDATVSGYPGFLTGVKNRALILQGNKHVRINGYTHQSDCIMDFDKCQDGYTVSMWLNFLKPSYSRQIYMSSGAHSDNSYGIAMYYHKGVLEIVFRNKSGMEWREKNTNILPYHWFHLTATWSNMNGLKLYINGINVHSKSRPPKQKKAAPSYNTEPRQFFIGCSRTLCTQFDQGVIAVDEFRFWPKYVSTKAELRKLGAIFHYDLNMDSQYGNKLQVRHLEAELHKNAKLELDAKLGKSLHLGGKGDHVSIKYSRDSCLKDISECLYGFMVSTWIKFKNLSGTRYYMSSGPKGFSIYSKNYEIYAEVIHNNQIWKTWTNDIKTGEWYFLEVSYSMKNGLSMYLNQHLAGSPTTSSHKIIDSNQQDEIYIGLNPGSMSWSNYPEVNIDQMDIYLADRKTLLLIDFIQRGRPDLYYFPFERKVGSEIFHPSIRIMTHNDPSIVAGKIGNAIQLDGKDQYVDVNEHPNKCLGNLDHCSHGFLISMWVRVNKTSNRMEYLSTAFNGLSFIYRNGKYEFSISTSSRKWKVLVDPKEIPIGEWRFIEISWHPKTGLMVYNNNRLIALDNSHGSDAAKKPGFYFPPYQDRFYLGKGKNLVSQSVFGSVAFDDIKYWRGDRNYLLMHGYIKRGRPTNYLVDMDKVNNGVLDTDEFHVMVEGDPTLIPGRIGYALNFNKSDQYLNFGNLEDVCLGNLEKCTHGFLLTSWIKFGSFHNNMHYFASGGISMYQSNGYIHVIFVNEDKKWKIQVPNPEVNTWHFVELAWHPDTGLKMYINNKLAGHSDDFKFVGSPNENKEFYIGAPSVGFGATPNFAIDEMEVWYGNRDDMVAFDYINRDGSRLEPFSMEYEKDNVVENSQFIINLVNGASVVEGKLGNGITMDGSGQYVRIDGNRKDCIYNLHLCRTGLTLGVWLKPFDIKGTKYFLSSPAYSLYMKNKKLHAKFQNATHSWQMSTPKVKQNVWQQIIMSWDPARGSKLYINHDKVAETKTASPMMMGDTPQEGIYIGTTGNNVGQFTPDFEADELQYYRTSVNGIIDGFGPFYVATETPEMVFRFDRLVIPRVTFWGSPDLTTSADGNVIKLNGEDQYIDVGKDVTCGGDLQNCVDGHVMRLHVKADKLVDNTYFLDSYPTSIYYKDGQLHAEMRTSTQTWHVNTTEFEAKTWQNIELDWFPDVGLRLFLNRREIAHDSIPNVHPKRSTSSRTFIGRPLVNSPDKHYFKGLVRQMELWRRNRSYHKPRDERTVDLSGNSYYGFNMSVRNDIVGISPRKEQFKLKFKNDRSQREGLLWYAYDSSRRIFLYIKDGDLFLNIIGPDNKRYKWKMKKPKNVTFNDGKMHHVLLRRDGHELYWSVDDIYRQAFSLPLSLTLLRPSDYIFIGGTPDNVDYTFSEVNNNFKGIAGNLIYTSGRYKLDILNMNPSIIHGSERTTISPPTNPPVTTIRPITFVSPDSYIDVGSWDISQGGTLKFKFYTNDPKGLLFFNGDARYYVAVEVYEGKLYLVYNFGDRSKRVSFFDSIVNDRQSHEGTIKIDPQGGYITLELDNKKKDVRLQFNERPSRPLPGPMYVGWVRNPNQLPWDVWAGKGFQGCLLNVKVNNAKINLASRVKPYELRRTIDDRCYPIVPQCTSSTCKNGNCIDYWNGYSCDCANEQFTGTNCDRVAPITLFDGSKDSRVVFSKTLESHTDDISLRFKTHLVNTTLFQTTAENSTDSIMGVLEDGVLKVIITINGQTKVLRAGSDLNDQKWHRMHLVRRGNQLFLRVDNSKASEGSVNGKGFYFHLKRLIVGSGRRGGPSGKKYIGYFQNFLWNNYDIFSSEKNKPGSTFTFVKDPYNLPPLVFNPITISNIKAYAQLPKLVLSGKSIDLMFKTNESSGILLFSKGSGNEFIALEIYKRKLEFIYDNGKDPASILRHSQDVSDNKWHRVQIDFVLPKKIISKLGGYSVTYNQPSTKRLKLDGPVYLGGLPKALRSGKVADKLRSTHGFKGCLASVNLNGNALDTVRVVDRNSDIKLGCLAVSTVCKESTCSNNGRCIQGPTSYQCDCDKTGYSGTRCTEQGRGYYIGKVKENGVIVYTYPIDQRIDSAEEELAFGFMTRDTDGVLTRITSSVNDDFIEIRMDNGRISAHYDTAGSKYILGATGNYSDGQYHTLYFKRNFTNAVLVIDNKERVTSKNDNTYPDSYFDKLTNITIGAAKMISVTEYKEPFHGIIGGYYFKNLMLFNNPNILSLSGDATVAEIPYSLSGSGGIIVNPDGNGDDDDKAGGGGTGGGGTGDGGSTGGGGGGTGGGGSTGGGSDSGGGGGGGGGTNVPIVPKPNVPGILVVGDGNGVGVAVDVPHYAAISAEPIRGVGVPVAAAFSGGGTGNGFGGATGSPGRAGAAAGTFLGILALGAGLAFGLIKLGQGGGFGFGSSAAEGGGISISSPSSGPVIQQSSSSAGGGAASGKGLINGSAGSGGGGGGGSSMSGFTYIGSGGGSAAQGGSAGASSDSATLRVTGTFSNKGTVIGTPQQGRAATAFSSAYYSSKQSSVNLNTGSSSNLTAGAGGGSSSNFAYVNNAAGYGGGGGSGAGGGVSNYNYESNTQTSNMAHTSTSSYSQQQYNNTMYSTLGASSGGGGAGSARGMGMMQDTFDASGYGSGSNTLSSSYQYQMKSYSASNFESQSTGYNTAGGNMASIGGPVVIADGVRVDCCLMTSDGKSVVTGSTTGAPQVWNMQTGELIRAMEGNIVGASNLHLACNGQLLVGSAHTDNLDVNEFSTKKGVTNRNLQIWDFKTGSPLVMADQEYCSALQVLSDGDKVALGRTDKYGNSTSIIVWDLLGNQPIKEMRYEASVGNNDYISFLTLSQNNRYAVAGFHNTYDNSAEFVVFDMTLTSYNVVEPSILKMDANPECTAVLPHDKAVTGLRNGDLVIWNLHSGQPSHQLLSSSGLHAHTSEVTAVALSEDSSVLVSASADGSVKVWDMKNEVLGSTLVGHTREVSCVAISSDNEIVVSGSQDGTIRLWRTQSGSQICAFNTNMDVFFVTMSSDNSTIVALGDKYGARKLIMLQVVRSKVRKHVLA